MPPRNLPVAIIGAGIGGLSAALALAARGREVEVFERSAAVGGKVRQELVNGYRIDAGPTVFTMRWVFEELFAALGSSFDQQVQTQPATLLARHAWDADEALDLYVDRERTIAAIGDFAGAAESRRYRAFCKQAGKTYRALETPFLRAQRPNPFSLSVRVAGAHPAGLWDIKPFTGLWQALQGYFHDPRLRQLFGRYATYCGSSPFLAPATLMLVSHVEQQGVWTIEGGMQRLVDAMRNLAEAQGVRFHFNTGIREIGLTGGRLSYLTSEAGERYPCSAAVCNADPAALGDGLFGAPARTAVKPRRADQRSLSAVTWCLHARAEGFPLSHHNVFFSNDYRREFDDLLRRRTLPSGPTVYVCAQDRHADGEHSTGQSQERLLCLINAPASGDSHQFDNREIELCTTRTFQHLARCGLKLHFQQEQATVTTPNDFAQRFPATGGALYGQASHGWRASFSRPGSRSRIPGLYLAGGGTHPGPGLPMAALSGCLAATSLLQDQISHKPLPLAVTTGGMSTR